MVSRGPYPGTGSLDRVIDLRLLREDPDRVRASQRARGEDVALVDALLSADERRRSSGVRFDELRAEQKQLGKLIPKASADEKAELLKKASQLAADVKAADAERDVADTETQELLLQLVNAAIAQATAAGFTPMLTPALVRPQSMAGTGFLGQAAQDVYHLDKDDLYLVGTSEVPLAAYHMDEILDADRLPLRYAGFSPCFRREAGSHGKDTRGIFRVHQFDKVEMFSYVAPEDSEAEHQRLLEWEKQWLTSLELPFRVIDVATGDLGSSAARKFDCEAWIPKQGKYRELTSTSDCTEFQSRRLSIRVRDGKQVKPLATLNGTLCAVPRTIVAILENHQQADGSVYVPPVLRPFLGGREVLEPVAK